MSLKATISVNKQPNIQDAFLSAARRAAARVTVFLMNGYQLRGVITAFDPYVVVVVSDGKQQVIHKPATTTIEPAHPVELEEKGAGPLPYPFPLALIVAGPTIVRLRDAPEVRGAVTEPSSRERKES